MADETPVQVFYIENTQPYNVIDITEVTIPFYVEITDQAHDSDLIEIEDLPIPAVACYIENSRVFNITMDSSGRDGKDGLPGKDGIGIPGEDGISFSFEDLTSEQKALLLQPATSQINNLWASITSLQQLFTNTVLNDWFYLDENGNVGTNYNLYSTREISAYGIGTGETPGTGGGGSTVEWGAITNGYRQLTVDGVTYALAQNTHTHLWADITDKPSTFTPSAHTHTWASIESKPNVITGTTASFTTELETKLNGIAARAEVNVQSDWNATSGDALILNKPTTLSGYGITDAVTIDTQQNILGHKTFAKSARTIDPSGQPIMLNGIGATPSAFGDYAGIGFHNPGINWANLIYDGSFRLLNSDFSSYQSIHALSFVKSGGTATQYLMADGSSFDKQTTLAGYGITDALLASEYTAHKNNQNEEKHVTADNLNVLSHLSIVNGALQSDIDFYSTGGVSAYGAGSGGSTGGGLIQTVYGYSSLGGTFNDATLTDTFNAYTINKINTDLGARITSLEAGSTLNFATTGSGNVVTSVTKSGTSVSVAKGLTAVLEGDARLTNSRPNPYALTFSGYSTSTYNGSAAVTVALPTKLSDLTNDSGYLTSIDADLVAIAALTGTNGLLRKTAVNTWSLDTNAYLTGNQTITVSGDATGSGKTSIALTLANSGVQQGTYNNLSTQVRPFTVDSKGRVTSIGTAVTITPAWGSITGKPTTISDYGITDVYAKTQIDNFLALKLDVSTFNDLFEKVNIGTELSPVYAIKAKYNFYSVGEVSAFGVGSGGNGGTSYSRLDNWLSYDSSKSGWVLSALLGNDLNTRVVSLESGSATTITTTGAGNAVTAVSKSGTTITVNKGLVFSEVGHTHYKSDIVDFAHTHNLSQIGITGLTANYLTKFNGSTLINSQVFDNGTNVGIGTASPAVLLDVNGIGKFKDDILIPFYTWSNTTDRNSLKKFLELFDLDAAGNLVVKRNLYSTGEITAYSSGTGVSGLTLQGDMNANGKNIIGANSVSAGDIVIGNDPLSLLDNISPGIYCSDSDSIIAAYNPTPNRFLYANGNVYFDIATMGLVTTKMSAGEFKFGLWSFKEVSGNMVISYNGTAKATIQSSRTNSNL